MKNVEKLHHHIDNGGISVDVDYDFNLGHTIITFNTHYFGYSDISASLRTWGTVDGGDTYFLKELGLMFLRASEKVRPLIDEAIKQQNI